MIDMLDNKVSIWFMIIFVKPVAKSGTHVEIHEILYNPYMIFCQKENGKNLQKLLPAFFAAWKSSFSIRCCAGSPSGNFCMKLCTWETTSSLVRYWYNPSDERTKNWSLGHRLWWWRDGVQDMYGAVPMYSFLNISSNTSFHFGCTRMS